MNFLKFTKFFFLFNLVGESFAQSLISYVTSIDNLGIPVGSIVGYMSSLDNLLSKRLGIPFFEKTRTAVNTLIEHIESDVESMNSRLEKLNLSDKAEKQTEILKNNLLKFVDSLNSIRNNKLNEFPEMSEKILGDFKKSLSEIASSSFAILKEGVLLNKVLPKTPMSLTNLTKSLMADTQTLNPQYIAAKMAMDLGLKVLPSGLTDTLTGLAGMTSLEGLSKGLTNLSNLSGLSGLTNGLNNGLNGLSNGFNNGLSGLNNGFSNLSGGLTGYVG